MRRTILCLLVLSAMSCSKDEDRSNNQNNENNLNNSNNQQANNAVDVGMSDDAGFETPFTYYQDIKPILDGRCVNCHVAGGIGPFPLGTYDAVLPLKDLVANSSHARTMPPFLPSPGCREYVYDPNLSDDQIDMISSWARGGAPEGTPEEIAPLYPNIPAAPTFDTTIEMPQPYTPQVSPDDYRCFVIDWPYQETKFVTGFGVEPGDARLVHHVIGYHATPDLVAEAEALDAADPGLGYTCFGGPGLGGANGQTTWLGAWAPGGNGSKFPAGTGLRVEPGSKVVLQIHYNSLTTEPVPDQTRLLFETADAVDKEAYFQLWTNPAWLSGSSMQIDAGSPDVMHRFLLDPTLTTGGRAITLYSASIHMHLLGSRATAWIQRDNGTDDCLVNINNYDFSWQGGAGFAQPVRIEPGDKLGIECHWDNSMENQPVVNGERFVPENRFWGEGTTDEMCLGIFYATLD